MRADPALANSHQIAPVRRNRQKAANRCVASSVCEDNLLTECSYVKRRICIPHAQWGWLGWLHCAAKLSKAESTEESAGIN